MARRCIKVISNPNIQVHVFFGFRDGYAPKYHEDVTQKTRWKKLQNLLVCEFCHYGFGITAQSAPVSRETLCGKGFQTSLGPHHSNHPKHTAECPSDSEVCSVGCPSQLMMMVAFIAIKSGLVPLIVKNDQALRLRCLKGQVCARGSTL